MIIPRFLCAGICGDTFASVTTDLPAYCAAAAFTVEAVSKNMSYKILEVKDGSTQAYIGPLGDITLNAQHKKIPNVK